MSADNFLTLSDYQQRNPNLLYKGIVQCFRKESKFLDSIKILTTGTMRVKNWREGSMSKIGNRKIGIDTTQTFRWAIIQMGNGELIEGPVDSWRDFDESDAVQITIKGVTYLTHYANAILATEKP